MTGVNIETVSMKAPVVQMEFVIVDGDVRAVGRSEPLPVSRLSHKRTPCASTDKRPTVCWQPGFTGGHNTCNVIDLDDSASWARGHTMEALKKTGECLSMKGL
jgi:hypothetical protein